MVEGPRFSTVVAAWQSTALKWDHDCILKVFAIWVGKHNKYYYIIMKPTNSPTQEKIGLKVAFGPLFPTANIFFGGLGLVLYRKQTTRNLTQPNSPQTP